MEESRDTRLRRLSLRSMRRGIREMDLILSDFAGRELAGLPDGDLDLYDLLLEESDHDLLLWITGALPPPGPLGDLVARIRAGTDGVARGLAGPT